MLLHTSQLLLSKDFKTSAIVAAPTAFLSNATVVNETNGSGHENWQLVPKWGFSSDG